MTDHSKKQIGLSLPHSVFSADWVRQNEAIAAAHFSLTLFDLMVRAGDAAFELARKQYPAARHWLILCGHGNNGGDGLYRGESGIGGGIKCHAHRLFWQSPTACRSPSGAIPVAGCWGSD